MDNVHWWTVDITWRASMFSGNNYLGHGRGSRELVPGERM